MRPIRAAATALVASLALSACNGGDDPADPMSTWTPSGTVDAPSTSPPSAEPKAPTLPDAATKATEAGARAFITYYWDLINYAQVTGDVKRLKSVSGNTCGGCNRAIDAVESVFKAGGHTEGGAYSLQIDRLKEVSTTDQTLLGVEAAIRVRNDEQRIIASNGTEKISAPKTSEFLTYLIWTDAAWRTDVLEPR